MSELAAVSLLVRDYDEAIAYYTTRLGFALREDTPLGPGRRWVVVAPRTRGTALVLARADGPEEEAAVGRQGGGRVWLFLATDDFARDHRAMRARGVVFAEEPRHESYGTVAVFEDLYGNRWDLVQHATPMDARRLCALVQSGYDRLAPKYAEEFRAELERKPFDREWLDAFAARLPRGALVADLGCGPAHVGAYLARHGLSVLGLDLSHRMLVEARSDNPGIGMICLDLRALPIAGGRLAGAVAFYSLIHLLEDGMDAAFAELARALAPGAPLLVAMHGGSGHIQVDQMLGEPVPMYATLVSLGDLAVRAERAGFTVLRAEARPPYPFEYPTPRLYLCAQRP